MVSRKTRLMSALLAILMAVSMLTAFVLPAVAEGDVIAYDATKDIYFTSTTDYNAPRGSQYSTYPDSTVYIVADDSDWRALVAAANATDSAETFSGDTIHFVADIDMKNTHVDPLSYDGTPIFNGTIDGHSKVFKNLLIDFSVTATNKYVALIGYSEGAVIQNLGIESGLINARGTASNTELMVASFVGESRYTGTFRNCWNAATIAALDAGNASVSGISRAYDNGASDQLLVDGCYNVGKYFG